MRALDWRAVSCTVSALVLAVALAGPSRAADDGFPLPEAPADDLIVARDLSPAPEPTAPQATPAEPMLAMPALPDTAETLIVSRPEPDPQTTAAVPSTVPAASGAPSGLAAVAPEPSVTVPLPDAPVTLAVDQDGERAALRARLDAPGFAVQSLPRLGRKERDALLAFYAARGDKPVWFSDEKATPAAASLRATLERAAEDALDPSDYPTPDPAAATTRALRADAELALSAAALAYARDARGGRLEPNRLSNLITPELPLVDPAVVLATLAEARDPGAALAAYQPQHPGYRALKAQLAAMREATGTVPREEAVSWDGPLLRPGMSDPRVPRLRARLDLAATSDTLYDDTLADAVKAFQRSHRVKATGLFDGRTASLLDAPAKARGSIGLTDLIVNMERWRWLPAEMGDRHIAVNLPEFTLRLVDGGRIVHRARVIVGKPETPTPVFSHRMDHVIVNPYWHIPPSILRKEILPGLAADPNYAARRGYEVIRRGKSISVRQPPGERNALGFIKFMFPNQHSVYLHDTPSRGLFANERRAYSHGCVRVDQPFRLADFVLGDLGYSEQSLRGLIGRGERMIRMKRSLPVHLTYFTVVVDENGTLQRREDIYNYDGAVKTALGLTPNGKRYATLR